jgi:hypothetical protein
MSKNQTSKDSFYFKMGLLLIVLLFLGFTPYIKHRVDTGSGFSPTLIAHTITHLGWYVLFAFQAWLISNKNMKLHMTLGKASIGLAIAMTITGFLMMKGSFIAGSNGGTPFTTDHFIILPFMDLVVFAVAYPLAVINRKEPLTHKHYMLMASILIMDPALARIGLTLGFIPIGLLLHFSLIAVVAGYDRKTLGAIHTATKVGFGLLVVRYAAIFLVGPTEAWASFVHLMLG